MHRSFSRSGCSHGLASVPPGKTISRPSLPVAHNSRIGRYAKYLKSHSPHFSIFTSRCFVHPNYLAVTLIPKTSPFSEITNFGAYAQPFMIDRICLSFQLSTALSLDNPARSLMTLTRLSKIPIRGYQKISRKRRRYQNTLSKIPSVHKSNRNRSVNVYICPISLFALVTDCATLRKNRHRLRNVRRFVRYFDSEPILPAVFSALSRFTRESRVSFLIESAKVAAKGGF